MKQLLIILALFAAGCSALASLTSPPPAMVTAAVVEQALRDQPQWLSVSREVAQSVLDQAGPAPSLDDLELLAYIEIDKLQPLPAQKELAYSMVKGIRKGLEADLAAMGILSAAERSLRALEFLRWLAGV